MLRNVLIIDDEPEIINTLKDYLEMYGVSNSRILTSMDPFEGLELFRQHKESISLVICDFYMPKANGPELCEIFKGDKPELCVILQTGDHQIKLESLNSVDYVLHKPFDYEVFTQTLDSHNFDGSKQQQFETVEPRFISGKFEIAVIQKPNCNERIFGVVFNQSKSGCGITVNSAKGLDKNIEIELLLGEFQQRNSIFLMQDKIKAKIVWLKVVNVDTYKIGIQYSTSCDNNSNNDF